MGGSGKEEQLVRALRPAKTEEIVSHRQNNNNVKGGGDPASAKQLVYFANCCFNSCVEQSHKDSVREPTVEEQLSSKVNTVLNVHINHKAY